MTLQDAIEAAETNVERPHNGLRYRYTRDEKTFRLVYQDGMWMEDDMDYPLVGKPGPLLREEDSDADNA